MFLVSFIYVFLHVVNNKDWLDPFSSQLFHHLIRCRVHHLKTAKAGYYFLFIPSIGQQQEQKRKTIRYIILS